MAFESEIDVVGSKLPAKNRYGQNGFQGSSSDQPGKHTTSGFLPQVALPKTDENWQTRKVDSSPIAAHPGMSAPKAQSQIPSNSRPVKRKA